MFLVTALTLILGLALIPYLTIAAQTDTTKIAAPTTGKISCPMSKGGEAPKCLTDSKSGCPLGKTTEAKATDATKGECPMSKMTEANATLTDPATTTADANCQMKGKCADLALSIKGMTCTGCEQKITDALMSDKGVLKVVSIDYKTGKAVVCYDPAKVEQGKLAELVGSAGYKAEIIPATATETVTKGKGACCAAGSKKCEAKSDSQTDNKGDSH